MKTIIVLSVLLLSVNMVIAQNSDTLTNAKIVVLNQFGLEPEVIIEKMNSAVCIFNVSIDSLISLKTAGVPKEIVTAMINKNRQYEANKKTKDSIASINPNNPMERHKTGIYCFKDSILTRIDAAVISQSKGGGFGTAVAQHYTYGLASSKVKSVLSGTSANFVLESKDSIEFYFYFVDDEKNSFSTTGWWWFYSAASPNEFSLLKFNVVKENREITVASGNAYGGQVGVDSKDKIKTTYEELGNGIYKVSITGVIKPGEYGFMYSGNVPSVRNNDRVFDFSVR